MKTEKLTGCADDGGAALPNIPDEQSQGTAHCRLHAQIVDGKLSLLLILESVLLSSHMKVSQRGEKRCPCGAQKRHRMATEYRSSAFPSEGQSQSPRHYTLLSTKGVFQQRLLWQNLQMGVFQG